MPRPQRVLVTGATGLVGSNVCALAVRAGLEVSALVRSPGSAAPLEAAGAEVVLGDVTDAESVRRAAGGADGVIHTAALLGGTWATATTEEFFRTNLDGTRAVLDAARDEGVPAVLLSTFGIVEWDRTITEAVRLRPDDPAGNGYIRSKLAAYHEGLSRAGERQDVRFVVPGCVYGPSLSGKRALDPTSLDGALLRGLNGELESYMPVPMPWTYAEDTAATSLAALLRGTGGRSYLALGRPEDVMSLPKLCNLGAEIAGIPRTVREDEGVALGSLGMRSIADPLFDSTATNTELGIRPRPVEEGLARTIAWFRELGELR